MTTTNNRLNSNKFAVSPSDEEINKIYNRELSKRRVKHFNTCFYISLAVGIFFLVTIMGTTTKGDLIVHVFITIVSFVLAFSARRTLKREMQLLEKIKNGEFKVIHTTITKTKGQDDHGNMICEVADESGIWGVKNSYSVHIGSPVIIAFDDNDWRQSYSEHMLEKGNV